MGETTLLTEEQILALAPDASSQKAGKGLSTAASWVSKGASTAAVWGECKGSGSKPYQTQIDLSALVFRCSCPSRKFPCKHGLGLLLLHAANSASFTETEPPAWVTEWLTKRAEREEKKVEKREKPVDEVAQAKRRQAREQSIGTGTEELLLWMKDIVRNGLLATQSTANTALFASMVRRMIDAKAPGLASMIRELERIDTYSDGWQSTFVDKLSQLYTVVQGFRNRATLPAPIAADIDTAVGFTIEQEELRQQQGIEDTWFILGKTDSENDGILAEHTWLYGMNSNTYALIRQFSARGQGKALILETGSSVQGELVFYPSAVPLRAIVKRYNIVHAPLHAQAFLHWQQVAEEEANERAQLPISAERPRLVHSVRATYANDRWWLVDSSNKAVSVRNADFSMYTLLSVTGGVAADVAVVGCDNSYTVLAVATNNVYFTFPTDTASLLPPAPLGTTSFWSSIVQTATIGTDKRNVDLHTLPEQLAAVCAICIDQSTDNEEQFLHTTALASAYRRSGIIPVQQRASVPEAPAEERPYCPDTASETLRELFSDMSSGLLSLWLQLCAQKGCIAPTATLVALLETTDSAHPPSETLSACIGKRGHWLRQINANWQHRAASHTSIEEQWTTGTTEQRKHALMVIRSTDPAHGRTLLQNVWGQENANTQAALLPMLAVHLSNDDTEWLETLLFDKRKRIKDKAVELLHHLPNSSVVQRYWHVLQQAVTTANRSLLSRTPSLQFKLPATLDRTIFETGIEQFSSNKRISDEDYILQQLVQSVPPSLWEQHLSQTPKDIIEVLHNTKATKKFLPSLAKAAVRFSDRVWAAALTKHGAVHERELLPLLDKQQEEAYLITLLDSTADSHLLIDYAKLREQEWSTALAHSLCKQMAAHPYVYTEDFFRSYAHLLPESFADIADQQMPAKPYERALWQNTCEALRSLIQRKQNIIHSFNA